MPYNNNMFLLLCFMLMCNDGGSCDGKGPMMGDMNQICCMLLFLSMCGGMGGNY
ncbi:MAG: hypothetical protein N4A63_12075 [Vallitalea sp.]|jgi:hypothetical protein|nr:hypothetical protein [Vallitalea sp.]